MSDRRKACGLCGGKPGRWLMYWAMPLDGDLIPFEEVGRWHPRKGDVMMCDRCVIAQAGRCAA